MKRIFLLVSVTTLFIACTTQVKDQVDTKTEDLTFSEMQEGDVIAGVNLTVAEGKRLIAKGLTNHPQVKEALKKGTIVITTGSTNTYVAEELANLSEPHGSFVIGYITPQGSANITADLPKTPDITMIDGKRVDMPYEEALKKAQKGDIVFKGANLLNYEKKQAAICIGSHDGGPAGRVRETEAHLIIPIGLEKETFGDLYAYEKLFKNKSEQLNYVPQVWVHPSDAEIFTEIEAIKTAALVTIIPYAAGGIAGREGGISLAIYGKKEEVQKALDFVATIQGEAPFVK